MSGIPDIEELVDNFGFFDEWTDRYRYLIELGRDLPPLTDEEKSEVNKVRGCQSQVWMVLDWDEAQNRMGFRADSDAAIVRGLIAVILALYSGKTPQEVVKADIDALFGKLGLESHLSPSRRNGFFSMVNRIKALAVRKIADADHASV